MVMISMVKVQFTVTMQSLCAALFLLTGVGLVFVQSNPDEVTNLPGLPSKPGFRHYSGYLNAANGRYLHYWFVESSRDPANDPLVLWMNGGPGCSSLDGFLTEHGPFHVKPGGKSLYINQYSWNSVSNMLFLEAPAGVGFSYSQDRNYKTDDDKVSLDNYVALQSFFKKFPQFAKHDFYVTGESYGGIYVPTLSVRVLNGTYPIKFKGFAVGNGMSDYRLNDNSLIFFFYYHGLIGKTLWDQLTAHCCSGSVTQETCNFHNNTDQTCKNDVAQVNNVLFGSGLNPYDLYDTCALSSERLTRLRHDMKHIFKFYGFQNQSPAKMASFRRRGAVNSDPPCISGTDTANYLNQKAVRAALHIPSNVQDWTVCSDDVSAEYTTLYKNMKDQYNFLLPKVRGLVYNGDVDMMCNFLGDQWFVDGLGRKVLSDYTYWKVGAQVAGFVKRYDSLDFVTIKGAGHMVPTYKPQESLRMITNFLFQKPY